MNSSLRQLERSATFAAGSTSRTISINVKGHKKTEGSEVFYLNLSGGTGAFFTDQQGTSVVRNDDR